MENKRSILYTDNLPKEISFEVKQGETLVLEFVSLQSEIASEITVNVEKNGVFDGVFADFSNCSSSFSLTVNLLEEGAKCIWHLASLSSKQSKKEYRTDVVHKAAHTEALISNYGIARGESNLLFKGTSSILKGSVSSNTKQEAKIIVFDPLAKGLASPVLKIDENDVIASHAAVVGRLNEDHLFYLASRGIDLPLAKRLIAFGYLRPVVDRFEDENLRKKLGEAVEGGFENA